MRTKTALIAGALLAMGLATASLAEPPGPPPGGGPDGPQPQGGGPGMGPGGGMEGALLGRILNSPKVAADLGLTEAQIQTLRNGAFDIQEQRVKLKADLELAAIQQARLLTGDTLDEKALMAAVEKTGAVRTELAKTEMRGLLLMRNTLSAEQRDKVREMMRKHMANRPRDERGQGKGDRPRAGMERREHDRRGPGGPGAGPNDRPEGDDAPPPDAPPPEQGPGE
ncbi:MAG: hypothetical protein K8T26_09850 [Lentisphaerae bacterium]|nr:hypothetical protein [Lentisphaerota bacterium]